MSLAWALPSGARFDCEVASVLGSLWRCVFGNFFGKALAARVADAPPQSMPWPSIAEMPSTGADGARSRQEPTPLPALARACTRVPGHALGCSNAGAVPGSAEATGGGGQGGGGGHGGSTPCANIIAGAEKESLPPPCARAGARWRESGAAGVASARGACREQAWQRAYRFYLSQSSLLLTASVGPDTAMRREAAAAAGCVLRWVGGEGRGGWPEGASALCKIHTGDFTAVAGAQLAHVGANSGANSGERWLPVHDWCFGCLGCLCWCDTCVVCA